MTNLASASIKATNTTATRTLGDRFAEVFNVKNFGALGNGSDATSAIQAAITAAGNGGRIYFPKGSYQITAPLVPSVYPSNLIFSGDGIGSSLFGNFEGFLIDQFSNPYQANSTITVEHLGLQNGYVGNNFAQLAAASSWSASGGNVNVTMAQSNPANVSAGCLVYDHSIFGSNTWTLIGTVKTWVGTALVLNSALRNSAGSADSLSFVQVYSAGASWSAGASTITMALSRPAGVPTGKCLVYNYSLMQNTFNGLWGQAIGIGTWSGTTFTFNNAPGATYGSQGTYPGSPDQLCFAPLAGGIRIGSSVGCSTVRNCSISGFIGITCSEVYAPTLGGGGDPQGAFSFSVLLVNNTLSNATSGAAIGSTAMYLCQNSLSLVNDASGFWIGTRMCGTANNIFGGRMEVCNFGIHIGADLSQASASLTDGTIQGISLESCVTAGVMCQQAGDVMVSGMGMGGQSGNTRWGLYLREGSGIFTMISSGFNGGYTDGCVYVPDGSGNYGQITFIDCNCFTSIPGVVAWRLPAQSWSAKFINCNQGPTVYTFANLPPAGTITATISNGSGGAGTILNVTAISGTIATLQPGYTITGAGVTAGTVITTYGVTGQGGGGLGGTGLYTVNLSQNTSPTGFVPAIEGDVYDISDCNTSTFLAAAAAGGSGSSARRRVRWNSVAGSWQVVG